mmetsp:Transcript_11612/g.23054  ORF Transcript_11612/g.23054 Transcript_11612/m.23054 type:complete len:201 (-) Transcript_11612:728-1330(-)
MTPGRPIPARRSSWAGWRRSRSSSVFLRLCTADTATASCHDKRLATDTDGSANNDDEEEGEDEQRARSPGRSDASSASFPHTFASYSPSRCRWASSAAKLLTPHSSSPSEEDCGSSSLPSAPSLPRSSLPSESSSESANAAAYCSSSVVASAKSSGSLPPCRALSLHACLYCSSCGVACTSAANLADNCLTSSKASLQLF